MHRRTFFAALGGLVASTIAVQAQTAGTGLPGLDGIFNVGGDALGAGLGAGGDILGGTLGAGGDILGGTLGAGGNILGGGALGGGDGFRAADLMGGEYSIETSKLALERSRSRAIREFAQLEINEQLSVTAALGAAPGSVAPRADQTAMVQKLASKRGGAFDHAYIVGQIRGHEELLATNQQAISAPVDASTRRVATVSIPTIQTHLAILHRLRVGLPSV